MGVGGLRTKCQFPCSLPHPRPMASAGGVAATGGPSTGTHGPGRSDREWATLYGNTVPTVPGGIAPPQGVTYVCGILYGDEGSPGEGRPAPGRGRCGRVPLSSSPRGGGLGGSRKGPLHTFLLRMVATLSWYIRLMATMIQGDGLDLESQDSKFEGEPRRVATKSDQYMLRDGQPLDWRQLPICCRAARRTLQRGRLGSLASLLGGNQTGEGHP
ncbi:hypothetical protein EAI_13895 [Harpegnathos saltator]|uniref:Uncharacterized protein n=1 Tax=Harpegnathos saltator TaxID=610380 RepID=E2BJU2_HARSA|nr:hypothetical protein EAI_13895 [Harpegnathos saltator]